MSNRISIAASTGSPKSATYPTELDELESRLRGRIEIS
jgi:hypothetical protein